MYKSMDADGADTILTGTTSDQIPINKADYAPTSEYGELEIPAYNGQMEVKDFSLQYDGQVNKDGRTPEQ
jgi:hypothetical protein